jgi:hypothetical protein
MPLTATNYVHISMDKGHGDRYIISRKKIFAHYLSAHFSTCDSGLIRQPKWGHLRDVHRAIKLCEPALIATDPSYISLGQNAEVSPTSSFFPRKSVFAVWSGI